MKSQVKIYKNPLNNRIQNPKYIFIENENEALVRYQDFGTDWVVDKKSGVHKVVSSKRFPVTFDRIKNNTSIS